MANRTRVTICVTPSGTQKPANQNGNCPSGTRPKTFMRNKPKTSRRSGKKSSGRKAKSSRKSSSRKKSKRR